MTLKEIIEVSDKEFAHLRESEDFDVTDFGQMLNFIHARDKKLLEGMQGTLERYYPEIGRVTLDTEHLIPVYKIWKELEESNHREVESIKVYDFNSVYKKI